MNAPSVLADRVLACVTTACRAVWTYGNSVERPEKRTVHEITDSFSLISRHCSHNNCIKDSILLL